MKTEYQSFIIEMMKHGDKVKAYQKIYPKANEYSARKSAERLLRLPEIADELNEAVSAIQHRAYKEAYRTCHEQQKTYLLSIMKKREILTQIATCQMKVGRYVKEEDGYQMVYEDPRPRDIIKAIEVDTRLEEACNRARNKKDPQLAQLDIYIDGRPASEPDALPDPDIPQGLVMLPKKPAKESSPNAEGEIESGLEQAEQQKEETAQPDVLDYAREYIAEKRAALQKDPLAESCYKHYVQQRDSAPPPRVLTDEEAKEIAKDQGKGMRNINQQGKMHFPVNEKYY